MQSKKMSLVEAVASTAIGFVVAWIVTIFLLPAFGFPATITQSFWITVVYTIVSVIRGYYVRRGFVWLHKQLDDPPFIDISVLDSRKKPSTMKQHDEGEYAEFVESRFKEMETPAATLMHAAIGVAGEGGELLDAVKKNWVYGKPVDRDNLLEEMGDAYFYMRKILNIYGWCHQDMINANTRKLLKRYPTGYTDEAAIARADKVQS